MAIVVLVMEVRLLQPLNVPRGTDQTGADWNVEAGIGLNGKGLECIGKSRHRKSRIGKQGKGNFLTRRK